MSLFDCHESDPMRIGAHTLSRRADPATSKEAARAVAATLGETMTIALGWLTAFPGSTASELDEKSCQREGSIRKRLNDLKLRGLATVGPARKCRVTGRRAQTWFPAKGEK